MDIIKKLVDESRIVRGAVTDIDAEERLVVGNEVFILINTPANIAVIRGEIIILQMIEIDGVEDLRVTVEFKGHDKPVTQSMMLCGMLNGRSALIGDEENGCYTRIFTEMEDALKYFETVQFMREIKALEKTASVSSLISRLLAQRKNPKKDT